jgi:hypothetical protein
VATANDRLRGGLGTSIEIRVSAAERKALVDVGCVGEASKRSQVSWTASSASLTLPRIQYAIENSRGRSSSNSSARVKPTLP